MVFEGENENRVSDCSDGVVAIVVSGVCFGFHEWHEFLVGRAAFWNGYHLEKISLYQPAIDQFDLALTKPLGSYWRGMALNNRAFCFLSLHRRAEAIRDYTETLRLKPDLTKAWGNRAATYLEQGQPQLALDEYNRALSLDPNYAVAYFQRGIIYANRGEHEKARSDFRDAIRVVPTSESAYLESGMASRKMNDRNGALSGFEQASNQSSGHATRALQRAGLSLL